MASPTDSPPVLSRRSFLKTLLGSAAALIGTGAYAFGLEPAFRLRVQRYALVPPAWPAGLSIRMAVVADIHVGDNQKHPYRDLFTEIAQNADVIFVSDRTHMFRVLHIATDLGFAARGSAARTVRDDDPVSATGAVLYELLGLAQYIVTGN